MYIKKGIYENVGPLKSVNIDFPFNEDGTPKPLIIVGENGSGKSTFLSNIVDAFYEMAGLAFNNATETDDFAGHQYYKAINGVEIHLGSQYLYSYLTFQHTSSIHYCFKSGNLSVEDFRNKTDSDFSISWKTAESYKGVTASKEEIEDIWSSNVICCFGPDRYEQPVWMGDKYYNVSDYLHPTVIQKWKNKLDRPISIRNVSESNLRWLLDVIVDSRVDFNIDGNNNSRFKANLNNMTLLNLARRNIERIMSNIIGCDVYFALNYRNSGISRFRIMRTNDNSIVSPTLESLSTGQISLFNMFATIVRYADLFDINKSIKLNDITGIVVIDEIELHLHTKLQKEVLPKLIKLFPKVQFIITTHSPLFLLGMKDTFGEDKFDIYELPEFQKIDVERFSEFGRAFEYLKQTQKYKNEVESVLNSVPKSGKPIIFTEGSTDWKHMKAAYNSLKEKPEFSDLFENVDFEFFEYEPKNSPLQVEYKLDMGKDELSSICEKLSKIPFNDRKYIFIADRDDEKTNKKMTNEGEVVKHWGNNVYSFILPVPESRRQTPNICIEHYYSDDEIKTEWSGDEDRKSKRLYMGNEFDARGIACDIDRYCEKKSITEH